MKFINNKNPSDRRIRFRLNLEYDRGRQLALIPGVVQNTRDLIEYDPQLKERNFLVPLQHPVMGVFGHPTPPYKLLKTGADIGTAPCLGEHTHYICTELLGITDEEFVKLIQDEVLA